MSITMEFGGLDDLIRECSEQATQKELDKVNRKALKACANSSKQKLSQRLPRSKNVNQSGRKGSRTFKHSADEVPMSGMRKKGERRYIVVGWDKGDNSPYFYTKFNEWGTSKRPPVPIFHTISKEINAELKSTGMEEYENLLKRVIQ